MLLGFKKVNNGVRPPPRLSCPSPFTFFANLLPTMSLFVLLMVTILVRAPTSVSAEDDPYVNCSRIVPCANIPEISYPFYGSDRPDYCGYPGFQLNCSGQYSQITTLQSTYRVLEINNVSFVLTVVRTDYTDSICPSVLANTTFNTSLFSYSSDTTDITLHYGCPSSSLQTTLSSQFNCNSTGESYFATRNTTLGLGITLPSCTTTVIVPANQTAVQSLDTTPTEANLITTLDKGFGLQWNADNTVCSRCISSGGQCGYKLSAASFACYCSDGAYPSACGANTPTTSTDSGGTNRSSLVIGLGVGGVAVIASVALVFWFLVKKLRKKETLTILNEDRAMHRVDDQKIEEFFLNYHSLIPKKYSYSDIKKMTNSFSDKVGQGGFGSVYTGKLRDGRQVAIKVLNNSKSNGEEFINEVASISRTSHVNIVTLLGYCHEGTKRALIYEYMANGSLDKFINRQDSSRGGPPLEWEVLFDIAVGIARGLEYLHRGCNTRIVHFDIKPHNILLDENFCPKISDFGLAKLCKTKESKMTSLPFARGTVGYIAPEVFCRFFGGVSYKSDVYSYSMMVLDMVGGRNNSHVGESQSSELFFPDWVFKQLEPDEFSRLHGEVTEEEGTKVRKMIIVGLWCIQTNPPDRPTMTKAVEMLEGNLQSLQIPPKPVLSSPVPLPQAELSSTISSSGSMCVVSRE